MNNENRRGLKPDGQTPAHDSTAPSNTQTGHLFALTAIYFSVAEPFATEIGMVVPMTIFAIAYAFYMMAVVPSGETIAQTLADLRRLASEVRGP